VRLADIKFIPILIVASFLLSGCVAGLGVTLDDGEIISYTFLAANNPELSEDVVAEIDGGAITMTVPEGTDVTALIADYVTNSTDVSVVVEGGSQVSGETTNNFSAPVTYAVSTQFSLTTRDYTVFVLDSGDLPLTGIFVSVVTGSDESGDGSQESPYATIAKGIAEAASDGMTVRVGRGTYSVSEPVEIVEGVSLYGGYDESDWSRDVEANITEIRDSRTDGDPTETVSTIIGESTITRATIVDGFTIVGADAPGYLGTMTVISMSDDASPTISNNRLEGPTRSRYVVGIVAIRASPLILNNIIDGGTTDMDDGSRSYGVVCGYGSPHIEGNSISGGRSGQLSFGVMLLNVGGTVERNSIDGGESGGTSGIHIEGNSIASIINNVIDGGDSVQGSVGIDIAESSPVVENNTISGGMGGTGSTIGIKMGGPDFNAFIINNIVFTISGEGKYCLYESNKDNSQPSLLNNDLFDCSTAFYHSDEPSHNYDDIELMEEYLTDEGMSAQDNLNIVLTLDSEFRIVGGYDLSDSVFPFTPVLDDRDGNPRSDPYSMGAYQY